MTDNSGSNWHTYDIGPNESSSEAVVRAVAAVMNQQLLELEPLHETIDTDALDALLTPSTNGPSRMIRCVTFTFGGCEVTVRSDVVRVRELTE